MKAKIILFLIALIIGMMMLNAAYSQDFYSELNAIRRKHFLRELQVDSSLVKESDAQINKIQNKYRGSLIHGSENDTNHKFKGEVLAKYCDSDLTCWMESPDHRRIILSRKAKKIGYAKINDIACARLTD